MNIKPSYRYQLADHTKSICIYYFVILCVFTLLFLTISISVTSNDSSPVSGEFSGMGMATVIFLFVTGLCSFKETFGMMMQNGISRKTMFIGRTLTVLTIAFGMALIDQFITFIFKALCTISNAALTCSSLYEQTYLSKVAGIGDFRLQVISLLLNFFLYLGFMSAGYLITLIYYRLNKIGKVVISVGVPISLFVALPIFDFAVTGGRISASITKFLGYAFGLSTHQPTNAMITCTLVFILFSGLSWLLLRRSSVRA